MKYITVLICLVILMCGVAGCTATGQPEQRYEQEYGDGGTCNIKDYGNGVLYFSATRDSFGSALSAYIEKHNAKVISISADSQGVYGVTDGYFVIVEDPNINKVEI